MSEYGITHLRYLLIVSAACQSLIVLWQLIRGGDTLPAFSTILFIAAIVASMGPLGFAAVSLRSQYSGFLKLLEEEKLITSGVWQTASQEPQFEIRLQLTDKLAWLEQHGGRDLVSALLPEPARNRWTKPPQCNSDPCQDPTARAKNFEDLLKVQGLQLTYRYNSPDPNEEKTEISLNSSSFIQLKPNTYVASLACSEYSSTGVQSGDLFINSENNCQDIILSRGVEPLRRISGLASHLTKNSTANKPGIEIIDEKCRWRIIFQDYRHTLIEGSTEPKKTYYYGTIWLEIEK